MNRLLSIVLLGLALFARPVDAQTYTYHVYIDSDLRTSTGCTISAAGQSFVGADYRLTATVSGTPPRVTARNLASCSGGTFGAGSALSANYPVGLNNGLPLPGGALADVIELSVTRSMLTGAQAQMRFGIGSVSASGSVDVLYTQNGQVGGPALIVGSPALIPTLGFFGALLMAMALVVVALRTLKRNRGLAQMLLVAAFLSVGLAAWAANFVADGLVGDWAGTPPKGMDALGDALPDLAGSDLVGTFAAEENLSFFFRVDVVDVENQPPVAVNDSYTTLEDTALNVAAPGVLANDSDADGNPITAQLVSGPTQGTLTLNANGSFSYTPNANANGTDSFTYNAFDGQVPSATPATVSITITPVNDVPVFTAGANQSVNEDAGAQTVNPWALGINDGDPEVTQVLSFTVLSNSNPALFSVAPAISATGVLTYTAAANASGSATLSVQLSDNGGTANSGVDTSAAQTFTITVNTVNDAPILTASNPPTVLEDAAPVSIANWASFNPGPPDEASQTLLGYQISAISNPALFATAPALANDGTLSYTVAANANGSSTFVARAQDSGGTANGGIDLSAVQTFTINVTAVNDAPSFTVGADQTVNEDAGPQTVNAWLSTFSDGDPEVIQALSFVITNNSNPALFSSAPSVSPTGTLIYTPAANANGSAIITLRIQDDGSNTPPNVNQSATQTFTINVSAINDAPSFVAGPNQTVDEDVAAQTVTPWATAISPGPADEAGQTVSFTISNNTNPALFSALPAVSPTGVLTYTPAANANGSATLTLILTDSGSNTSPNVNVSAPQIFTITVSAVNDAPVNTVPPIQTTPDTVPLVFNTANLNAISLSDIDAAAGIVQMSFGTGAPANGTLTLANPGGVLTSLTGNGSALVTATGTITALNLALNGPSGSLTYTPVAGTTATRTITVISNDQGNTGSGGALSDTDTIDVNADAAPDVSLNVSGTVANSVTLTLTFTEAVNVSGLPGVTLVCGSVVPLTGTTGSNITTLTLGYTAPLPSGSCVLSVPAGNVADVDTIDPPDIMNVSRNFAFTVDEAPIVISSAPITGALTANDINLVVNFSEPVNFNAASFALECSSVPQGFSVAGTGTATATIDPANALPSGPCALTVLATQIDDVDGFDPPANPIGNATINFTVDAPPSVIAITPADTATGVSTAANVVITFSEPVNVDGTSFSMFCGVTPIGAAVSGTGTNTITLDPLSDMPTNSLCTVTVVANQVTDVDTADPPDEMVANSVSTFTTDAAPTLTGSNPADNAINVGIANNLTVDFSEAVTFSPSAFTLECPATAPIAFTVSGSGTSTATIDPMPATLPINTLCVLTVDAAQITDVDSADPPDTGAGITTIRFTTVNDNPPAVSSAEVEIGNTFTALPLGAGVHADTDTDLRITFSEAVNATGNWASLTCGVSGTQSVGGGTLAVAVADPVFTLNPSTNLTEGENCTLTIFAAQVDDDDAIDPPANLPADAVYTFSVVDTAPRVLPPTTPVAAATVPNNQTVTIDFTEIVDVAGGAISWQCGATAVSFTPALPQTNVASLTLTPTITLPEGSCSVTLESTLIIDDDAADPPDQLDGDGNLDTVDGDADDFVLTFDVDTPPSPLNITVEVGGVPSFLPLGLGQVVDVDTNIITVFSENIDASATGVSLECPAGNPVPFAGLPVTNNTTITVNPSSDLPGGTLCQLTLNHTGISDADTFDPPNQLDGNGDGTGGDSIVLTFTTQSLPTADVYTVTPHLTFSSPTGVRANDIPPSVTITGFGPTLGTANGTVPNGTNSITASGAGGRVVMNPDGTFALYPDASDDNTDGVVTFFYTITGGASAQVTLTFEAEEFIWFVDNTPGATVCTGTNNGTQACPEDTLADVAAADTNNDVIFIDDGNYTCGITLLNDQIVIGDGSGSTLAALIASRVTPVAGSDFAPHSTFGGTDPVLTSPAGDCFILGQNNSIRGLTVSNTPTGHAFQDNGGTIGTATLAEISFSGTGGIVNLANGGTLNATVDAMTSTSSPSAPILLTNMAGTITQTGGGTITQTGNFDLFDVNGGSASASISAALNATGGNGSIVDVSGGHTGTLTFTGLVSSAAPYNGDNLQFDNADGTYNFNGETDLLAGAVGVNIQNGSGGSFTSTDTNSSIANINGISFRVNASTMTVNSALDITHTAQANRGVEIITGTGTTNFTGTLQIGTVGSPMLSAVGVFLDDTGAANAITFSDLNIITGTGGGAGSQAFVSQTSGRIAVTTGSIDCNGNLGADNHCFDVSNTTSSGVTFASFVSDHDDLGENGGGIFLNNTPGTFTFTNVSRMTGNNAAIINATNFGNLNVGTGSTGNVETSNRPAFDLDNGTINVHATVVRSTNSTTQGIDLSNILDNSTLNLSGTITVSAPTSTGVNLDDIEAGAGLAFGNLAISNRGSHGIFIQDHDGALISFGDVDIDNGLNVGGNGVTVQKSAAAVASTGSIRFASLDISGTNSTVNRADAGGDGIPDADTHDGHAVKLLDHVGGLIVTGDGTQGNGGTIQNIEGDGFSLTRSGGLDLDELTINNIGTSNQATVSVDNAGIYAYQLLGSNQIGNSTISRFQDGAVAGGSARGISVVNVGVSFVLLRSVDTTYFNDNALLGDDAIQVVTAGVVNGAVEVDSAFSLGHVSNNSEFFQISGDAVAVLQNGGGTLTTSITDSTFRDTIAAGGFGGLDLSSAGFGVMSNTVDSCLFYDLYPFGVNNSGVITLFAAGTVDYDATVRNSTFGSVGERTSDGRGAIRASTDLDPTDIVTDFDITITNNTIDDTDREAISILPRGPAVPAAGGREMDIVITGNDIGQTTPVANDAGLGREGIEFVSSNDAKIINLRIENNTIRNFVDSSSDESLDIRVNDNTTLNSIIRGNTFSQSGSTTDSIDYSINSTGSTCMDMNSANTSSNAAPNGITITETAGTFRIEDIGGAAIPAATVKTFIEARNTGIATVTGTFDSCNDH